MQVGDEIWVRKVKGQACGWKRCKLKAKYAHDFGYDGKTVYLCFKHLQRMQKLVAVKIKK